MYADVSSSAWQPVSREEIQFRIVSLLFDCLSQTGHMDFTGYIVLVRVQPPSGLAKTIVTRNVFVSITFPHFSAVSCYSFGCSLLVLSGLT